MSKKKISVRDYKFSDGYLKQKADDVIVIVKRDIAQFNTRGVTAATITAFETSIANFDNTQTDEELEGAVSVTTDAKDVLANSLKTAVRTIRTMAQNKLGEANAFYRSFGFDAMDELPDEQLYRLGRRVVRVATDQLPQLAGEGLTTALITNLNTIATNFDNALDAKEAAVKHRDIMTQERIDKANEVYKELVRLCNTGKDIWTTTDEARYNDYVIYDTPGGVPETPPAT